MTEPAAEPRGVPKSRRLHDLDALRGFAMLLGIVLHATLAFFPSFWPVQDNTSSLDGPYDEILHAIHGFRMPLFFMLSGFFTAMLWRRRGLGSLLEQRLKRVALPLLVGLVTIVPLMNWVSERAAADQFDSLLLATLFQNETAVRGFLDDGINPDAERGSQGETALHLAAVVDTPDIAALLLEAGADPYATDDNGDAPFGYAFFVGADDVADVLVEYGFPDVRAPGGEWSDLRGPAGEVWGYGAPEVEDELGLESWITSFHHLWFLWFLVWLVAGFALVAVVADAGTSSRTGGEIGIWPRRIMWLLVPVVVLPQLAMGQGGEIPTFGPDTSTGLIPIPHVLMYYALFFAFGALMYDRRNRNGDLYIETIGRRWMIVLPLTVVVLYPLALGATYGEEGDWFVAAVLQVLYAWAMIAGLMGLFRAFLSKERRGVRYLSDASYWLYLAHLPLIIAAQAWMREWDLPSGVKFTGLVAVTTALLLLSYQGLVRYTPVGTMLNGKRTRPAKAAAGS